MVDVRRWTDREEFRGKRLLIVDDDPDKLLRYAHRFRRYGFEVVTLLAVEGKALPDHVDADEFGGVFHHREEFLRFVHATPIDAMLTDRQMIPGHNKFSGEDATLALHMVRPDVPVVMHTLVYYDSRNEEEREMAMRHFGQARDEYRSSTHGLDLFVKGDEDGICACLKEALAKGMAR